ncbi:hypothetical protein [Limnoglobus roseus]|uniref:Uncharacterized protein n=1 Tax=Limnoglobus roseus TaxID=2598579 RepID=A0A5C1AM04_9BACT|nr:hypothetical protein [Limnoglobus roseus]QEL19193.1 hypothetical protein PX52LOC_06253 [Limnoglobus roseus]
MNPLLTATQLVHWADTWPAQDALPLLVRRLILGRIDPLHIDFPAGDSINRPGYDGLLRTAEASSFIPAGQSVWEFGAENNPKRKANEDYSSRTKTPRTVTPAETTFELAYRVGRPGFLVWAVTLVTTLPYPAAAVSALCSARRGVVADLAHVKTTFGIDVLKCGTAAGML